MGRHCGRRPAAARPAWGTPLRALACLLLLLAWAPRRDGIDGPALGLVEARALPAPNALRPPASPGLAGPLVGTPGGGQGLRRRDGDDDDDDGEDGDDSEEDGDTGDGEDGEGSGDDPAGDPDTSGGGDDDSDEQLDADDHTLESTSDAVEEEQAVADEIAARLAAIHAQLEDIKDDAAGGGDGEGGESEGGDEDGGEGDEGEEDGDGEAEASAEQGSGEQESEEQESDGQDGSEEQESDGQDGSEEQEPEGQDASEEQESEGRESGDQEADDDASGDQESEDKDEESEASDDEAGDDEASEGEASEGEAREGEAGEGEAGEGEAGDGEAEGEAEEADGEEAESEEADGEEAESGEAESEEAESEAEGEAEEADGEEAESGEAESGEGESGEGESGESESEEGEGEEGEGEEGESEEGEGEEGEGEEGEGEEGEGEEGEGEEGEGEEGESEEAESEEGESEGEGQAEGEKELNPAQAAAMALARILGMEPDAASAFGQQANASRTAVAPCLADLSSALGALTPEQKVAATSACASVRGDGDLPGLVLVVSDLDAFGKASALLPPDLKAAIECITKPIYRFQLDPEVKVVLALSAADGGAEEPSEGQQNAETTGSGSDSGTGSAPGSEAGSASAPPESAADQQQGARRLRSRDLDASLEDAKASVGEFATNAVKAKLAESGVSLECAGGGSLAERRLALRVPGLQLSWKSAMGLTTRLLGKLDVALPEVFGYLPDILSLSNVALDFAAPPAVQTARILLSASDIELPAGFGLVNNSASFSFDAPSSIRFELSGSVVLPFFKNGLPFKLPLMSDAASMILRVGMQDKVTTIGSALKAMGADAALADLPQIPVLSSGLDALLGIQIKDLAFSFCRPGASPCTTRLSLRALLPPGLLQSDLVPLSLDNPTVVFTVVEPFSSQREVDVRIDGDWSFAGNPLKVFIGRQAGVGFADVLDDFAEPESDTEVASRRRRLHRRQQSWSEDPRDGDSAVELGDGTDAAADLLPEVLTVRSLDHVVQLPDIGYMGHLSLHDVPLVHLNHHLYRDHLRRQGLNGTFVLAEPRRLHARAAQAKTAPRRKPGKGPTSSKSWTISASSDVLPFDKLLSGIGADIFPSGPVEALIDKLELRTFALNDFDISITLGSGQAMLRVAATADLFENARVQLLAGKQSGGRFQGTLALALPGSFFTDLLELMMPGFAIPGLNLVASGSTLAFVASSRDLALDGPMVLDAPLDFLPSIKRGLSIGLQMGLPSDCGGSGFCDVMVSLLGRDVRLQIGAGISPPDIALSAAVSNLRISSGLTLTAVGFSASFPSTALFLSGSIALTVDADRDPLQLQARIGVKGASVVLGASMTGIWRSAFGWDRLSIGNIVLEVGITAALGAPSILVGGQVAIGRGCYGPDFSFLPDAPCIGGSIYVSFDPVNPQNNWFAGDMTQLDVKRIILAFTDVAPDPSIIPAPLLNSGFSGPTSISLCPGGNCAAPGRQYQQGFFLNGTLNILDVTARVQISVSMGRGIKLLVELDPVKLAGGLIEIYRSKQDTDRGPILNVALEYDRATELGLTLSAYVKVFMFQLETIVSITPTEYILSFSQKFFVFDVSFRFQAAIGSRSKFSVTGDFDMRSFQQFVDGVLEALGSWAKQGAAQLDSARREVESKRRAVDDARKSVCDWKDKCTEAAEKVSCGRRRVRRSELPLQEEALVPPQDPADLTDAERLEAIVLEKRWSAFTNAFRSVGNAASGAVNTVSDAARRAAEQAAAAVARARAEAERVAREQAARAAEAARIAREEMERRAREAAEAAQREAQRVKDLAEKQAREAAEAAKREAERVQQQAAEQARRAQEAMAAAQKAAQEQARRVQEAAAAAQQAAQEQARRAQEAMAAAAAAQAQRVRDALAAAAAAAQAEAQRVKDETERRAREMAEAARIAAENAARETERRAREAAEAAARFQEEARRRAIEAAQAAQREAQRIRDAAERAAREAQERLVAEAARARELAERAAREAAEAARREAERIRNELAAKVQAISNGACRGWNMVSGLVVNTACQSACTVAQGGLDIATVALQASEQGLAGISEGVKAAAKMADFLGDRVRSMISFSAAGFVGSVDADFNSKFMAGSVGIRIKGVFFGEKVDVDFTLDASDVGKAAREFFDRNVRGAAEKALTLLQLSKRDLADVDFVAPGHFRFRKRQLLDGLDTILFDSRDMTLDDGIELHREQIRRRLQMRGGALPEDFFDGLSDREVFGERISAYQLPVVPALTQGYDEGPAPGLAGGEDNDFRIRFGDRYVSCGTAVGAFSREGPACRLRKKVDATIFLSTAEPLGQSFRTSSGLCLAVNSRSSIVLTPCYSDLPNGVWRYDNATGQLSSLNAGVVAAPDGGSPIAAESIAIASAASDGKCMTATKAGKLRVTTCGVKGEASAAVMRGQAFRPRINAESINLGDLISFHSTGLVDREYIAVDLDSLSVGLFRGNLTVQQDDKRAAFKVLAPICGANYHFTFESVAKPGFFVAVDPDNRSKLIVTDKLRRKDDACFLPTPGPSRPIYAAGCPGLTFSLRSRSIRNSYVRANEDGNSLVLAGGRDPALMTCWRPVPPTGAPSAAHPVAEPQDEEGESGEGGADVFDADGLAEDVAEDEGNNLGLDDDS